MGEQLLPPQSRRRLLPLADALANWRPFYRGTEGMRDEEGSCTEYRTGKPAGDCLTDGHYLCDQCSHRATCKACGKRPSWCECPPILEAAEIVKLLCRIGHWDDETRPHRMTAYRFPGRHKRKGRRERARDQRAADEDAAWWESVKGLPLP